MARGGISGERGRGGGNSTRGRAFKKSSSSASGDREGGNSDATYSSVRPKYQESLKNQENKYYDDRRINGKDLFIVLKIYLFIYYDK